ncbi:MAG TPA: sulfur carrier protein ThiS [Bacteroidales bacterium]|nr:sulfur carrier protein ThiS [Bacteroidales bacterium]
MKITLNNKPDQIDGYDSITVSELLKIKNFTFKFLAVRINGIPVLPANFENAVVKDGDTVIVMHLISGG